jgi:N-methylhydantoinase A/oxoprolinase/acetone carboxylase beta subunit
MGAEIAFDMRFVGQTATLRVRVEDAAAPDALERAHADFTDRYRSVFGYVLPDTESEIENIRVRLTVPRPRIEAQVPVHGAPVPHGQPWRAVFDGAGEIDCTLWDLPGDVRPPALIAGPAVVVRAGSTAVIHPGQAGMFDPFGNLVVREQG